MALSNRQTFFFDGQTYNYRITEAAIRRFERDGKRRIHSGMSLTMVVRALYYVAQNSLPSSIGENELVDGFRKGLLCTRKNRGEYSLRGIRYLMVKARKELIGTSVSVL